MKYAFLAFLLLSISCSTLQAQSQDSIASTAQEKIILADTLPKNDADSVIASPEQLMQFSDSLGSGMKSLPMLTADSSFQQPRPADSIRNDSTKAPLPYANQPRGDIQTTIEYQAEDSIFFDMASQTATLYGNGKIDYGTILLEADRIKINWVDNIIEADYTTDSTGAKIGKPIFTDAGQSYETDEMTYNFQSRKAIITGIITQQDEAYIQGERVKKNEDNEMFIRNAKYTTCNLADPHFHISSRKLKAIPGNKVLSGPFNLAFREIETPLGFLFGMFPQPKKKTSGVIVPSYGEENRRGFFLRDGGYYFAISDYVDLRLTGSIFSKGGYSINANTNYKKRYAYNGGLRFSFNRFVSDDVDNQLDTRDFSLNWNHSPANTGTSRFSSSVNIRTNSFNQNNNLIAQDFTENINAQFSSNISYNKRFEGTPFNFSATMRHNQNVQTEVVTITAPEVTYNMNRIYPFENIRSLRNSFLGKLNFSHNFTAKMDVTNAAIRGPSINVVNRGNLDDSLLVFNGQNLGLIFDRAKIGGRHNIPLSTSFNIFKYITVSPNVNYSELWYTKELNYSYDPVEQGIRVDTVNGFSRAGWYTTGASFNTRLYGTVFFNKGKIRAIRHVLTPQVNFSYSPDFTSDRFGYFQEVQVDESGRTQLLSRYEGFLYGSPPTGESAAINITLNNNVEMKVQTRRDSTGKDNTKKIKIFDNLSMGTGYNFLADSFKLSDIRMSTRTSFFNNLVNVNLSGTLDPYVYKLISRSENGTVQQRRLDQYTWNNGQGLGTLKALTVALGFRLSPSAFQGKQQGNEDQNRKESEFGTEEELEFIENNPEAYIDFTIPWSLSASYNINRRKTGFQDATVTQSLTFNGDLSLTEKTKISFSSGYDFENSEFTQTRIGVIRDLHCWTMRFDWVPFGRFQSYNITINAKSSLLQDLKLERRRQFFDNF